MKYWIFLLLVLFTRYGFAQQDSLVWSDEFNGSSIPDPAKWGYDLGNNGWGNNEIQNYTNLSQNAHIDSGILVIEAIKSYTGWTSARLLTHNKFDFKYGRVVFRAKLPVGSGTWPALWMLGSNFSTAGWPGCGEIDVMEEVGKDPCAIHSSIHTTSSSGNTINTKMKLLSTCSTEFHNYQVKWTSEKMEFSIDSVLFYTYNPSVKNSSTWPFDKTCFIIINVAMGGNWGSDPQYETGGLKNGIDPSLYNAKMEIDYVRVYQTNTSSVENPENNKGLEKLNFFPNPSDGKLKIDLGTGITAKGNIYNVSGQNVFQFLAKNEFTEIDLSSLNKGLYCITLQFEGKILTQKLVLK